MTANRLRSDYSGKYPKNHSKRENRVIETAVATARGNTAETFENKPLCGADNGGGAATGSTGDINLLLTGKTAFEYCVLGAGQTIVAPTHSSSGLDISLDQTDNEGVELTQGITALSRSAFVVGTSAPFYAECKFSIADVSGTDDCAFGLRKAEAYQAAVDDYDEMACLNVISGDIKIETILNGAATVTTDTTQDWADAATHTLRIEVDAEGKCRFMIDGSDVTVTAAHTFDDGEVVVPFLYFLHATDLAGAVNVQEWNCGLL